MKKYIIAYEYERMKDEEKSAYEYLDDDLEYFDTLEKAFEKFKKFESSFLKDSKKLYRRIATVYSVEVDENNNFISDFEEITSK